MPFTFGAPGSSGSSEESRLLWRLAGLGFQFGTEIIAGVLIGWFVDRMWGTAPWGVLIGSLAGIAVATFDLVRKAMRLNREMDMAKPTLKRAKPQEAAPPEEDLSHDEWKALRDRELEPDDDDDRER